MSSVSVVIVGISRLCDGVDSVDVIDVAISVVVNSVPSDLLGVCPHVSEQVGVIVVDSGIDNQNERLVISWAGGVIPGGCQLHVRYRPLKLEVRIVGSCRREKGPVGRAACSTAQLREEAASLCLFAQVSLSGVGLRSFRSAHQGEYSKTALFDQDGTRAELG